MTHQVERVIRCSTDWGIRAGLGIALSYSVDALAASTGLMAC